MIPFTQFLYVHTHIYVYVVNSLDVIIPFVSLGNSSARMCGAFPEGVQALHFHVLTFAHGSFVKNVCSNQHRVVLQWFSQTWGHLA